MQYRPKLWETHPHNIHSIAWASHTKIVAGIVLTLILTGCHQSSDDTSTESSLGMAQLSAMPQPSANLNTSFGNAIDIGRQKALLHSLAKRWILTEIAEKPTNSTDIVLDLGKIEQGLGILSMGKTCRPLLIRFDTSQLHKGELFIADIERMLDNCSTPLEDELMIIIAETRSFETAPLLKDQLILHSFQETLEFVALSAL